VKVIVDTSVWSLALRRKAPVAGAAVDELTELIREGRAAMVGVVRQEILCGIRLSGDFTRLRDRLRAFPDEAATRADYERAAEHFNACRGRGIQGSNTDFLLCALSERLGYPLFTTDQDFQTFGAVIPIRLHTPRR